LESTHARIYYDRAYALGDREAAQEISRMYERKLHPEYYLWGFRYSEARFLACVDSNQFTFNNACRYQVGQLLHIIPRRFWDMKRVGQYTSHMEYYSTCFTATKNAVNVWTKIAIRLCMVKDIRKLIVQLVWASRTEGLY